MTKEHGLISIFYMHMQQLYGLSGLQSSSTFGEQHNYMRHNYADNGKPFMVFFIILCLILRV